MQKHRQISRLIYSLFSFRKFREFHSAFYILHFALLAMLALPSIATPVSDVSARAFVWNEANARMSSAKTPADYLQAAQVYQQLTDMGVRNGSLFYNLGTALLQAGRYDDAIDAFGRAERYLGYQPDINRNLKIAMVKKSGQSTFEWPWYRILLFWHFMLATPMRLAIAVAAFTLFWIILILRRLGLRHGVSILAGLAVVIFILSGSSAATSWHQEATARHYHLDVPAGAPIK